MTRILAIARNTFRENIRDKVLYNLILFALIMILSSLAIGQLSLGNEAKVIVDLGLVSISVFGTLIAIFIGIGLVYKELEKRTVYALLSKPIHRHEFILGKYAGLLFTLLVNAVVMTAGLFLVLMWRGGIPVQGYLRILPAVFLIFLSFTLTTAIALLFSTFSTPALSALFTLFLWAIGHFSRDLLEFSSLVESRLVQGICRVLYYVLPNFGNFTIAGGQNAIQAAAYFEPLNPAAVAWITLYAAVYCTAILGLAMIIFSRRDFK
jgi:ABC-type transport system involved in multi-copper enzyme maturation permease subunit